MPIFCTSLIHWNFPNAWYVTFGMSTCPGVRAGNEHLTESVQNLPKELVIPNDQIKLLNSIGQGEPSCMVWEYGLALALVTWSNIIQRAVRGTSQDKTRQDKTSELNLQN